MSLDKLAPEGFSIGVELPLDNDWSRTGATKRVADERLPGVASMQEHAKLAKLVDTLGYRAAWLRDVPLYDPKFGDAAQVFETFSYLGFLASHTKNILLGTAAIILPLREPWLVRKAYNTLQVLSNERILLGLASGDRPIEYPVFEQDFGKRSEAFRKGVDILLGKEDIHRLTPNNLELLPEVSAPKLLVAGLAQQSPKYIGEHMHGWLSYPGTPTEHIKRIALWQKVAGKHKSYISFIHLDFKLHDDNAPIKRHHFGISTGKKGLIEELKAMKEVGVNHIGLHFRRNEDDLESTLRKIAQEVLPLFH